MEEVVVVVRGGGWLYLRTCPSLHRLYGTSEVTALLWECCRNAGVMPLKSRARHRHAAASRSGIAGVAAAPGCSEMAPNPALLIIVIIVIITVVVVIIVILCAKSGS